MADVTTTFAAKDESFAKTVDNLNGRLQGFQAETQSFTSKVGEMAKGFAAFAIPIAGVAAAFFGARGAAAAFTDAIRVGGELNDLAARTGETAGELAVLQRAFQNAGMSGGEVGTMLNRLQRFMIEASEGGSKQGEAMEKLGLSYDELKKKSPSEQLQALAREIAAVEDPAQRSAIAMQIFGRGGGEMMPLLRAMGVELDNARAQLGSYPDVINRANKALDDIGDNFAAISTKAREFATGLLVNVAPALADITSKIAQIDAAGFGMMLSDYLKRALEAASAAYRLGEAIDSVKLAIQAITNGNFSEGLSLMWVTMKVAALNAINEVSANFRAALQTVADFLAKMFDPQGALAMVFQTMFRVAANYLKESLYSALGDFMEAIGRSGMAETFRYQAETAGRAVKMELFSIGSQIELVGEQAAEAGKAMPKAFSENKAALDPLFDLTDSLAEQQRLQSEIKDLLGEIQPVTEAIAENANDYADAVSRATDSLQHADSFSGGVAFNLQNAADAADRIPPAFSLGDDSAGNIEFSLDNAATRVEDARGWLDKGAGAAEKISIFGNEFATSAANAGAVINNAKVDANIVANAFTGMSDRMNKATNATSQMLDKMRESFHFGQKTQQEVYESARAAGKGIIEASREAAKHVADQEKANSDMRRLEVKATNAENARDRAYKRAADMEQAGQQRSAHNARMRADERYTKSMEKLRPDLEKASEAARKNLEEGSETIGTSGDSVSEGGEAAAEAMEQGGTQVSEALEAAADPFKQLAEMIGQDKLALETTLEKCRGYLENIDKNLPQNALS
jgi:Mg2+ and Co2+ transporter CorA